MFTLRENAMAIYHHEQPDFYGDIFQIIEIFPWNENLRDAGAFGCHQLFGKPADRRHCSAKRYFSGHCDMGIHRMVCKELCQGGRQCNAGRRTVFRYCSFRYMDVQVLAAELFCFQWEE